MNDMPIGLISAKGLNLNQLEHIQTHVQSWQTEGGARVRFVETRGLPIVDVVLRFNAGTVHDSQHPGLAALTLYMLGEGCDGLDGGQWAERLESLGAIFDKHVRLEYATLSLRSLSSGPRLDPAIELFTSLAARPALSPSRLAQVKQQLLALQASRSRHALFRARLEAYQHLFEGHPYGNPLGSTTAGIEALTVDDLEHFHQRAYSANNLQMIIVGDLSKAEAQAISKRISEALPQGWATAELPPVPGARATTTHIEQPGASTAVLLAAPLHILPIDPDYLALVLANEVLGEGFHSRLMHELRQRRGLTYDIRTRVSIMSAGGLFTVEWEIASPYLRASQDLVVAVLQSFIEQGPTDIELQLARQQIAGRLMRDVAQNKSLAALLAEVSHQQQPDDHLNTYLQRIAAMTPKMVRDAIRRWLDLTWKVQISVGPTTDQLPLPQVATTDQ